jgi:hypothetical protein
MYSALHSTTSVQNCHRYQNPSTETTATTIHAATSTVAEPGFIDREPPTVDLAVVETLDGRLGLGFGVHLHEAEALVAAGIAASHYLHALRYQLGEQLVQIDPADLMGKIPLRTASCLRTCLPDEVPQTRAPIGMLSNR